LRAFHGAHLLVPGGAQRWLAASKPPLRYFFEAFASRYFNRNPTLKIMKASDNSAANFVW
jgi:hypothetical protein